MKREIVKSGSKKFTSSYWVPLILGILFFFAISLFSPDTIKTAVLIGVIIAFLTGVFRFETLLNRIWLPFIVLSLYVLMDGISTLYAGFGKASLNEFLKVLAAYVAAVILMSLSPKHEEMNGRWVAYILATCTAAGSLVSIDLLSTHLLSNAFISAIRLFNTDYESLAGVEAGVRMVSIFTNPNLFAGFSGIGVLLSIGLADTSFGSSSNTINTSVAVSGISKGTRFSFCYPRILLYINSLGFLLAFSMGASAFLLCGFIALIVLEPKRKRTGLIILMAETLVLCLVSAIAISSTSFQPWNGLQPVPIVCTVIGAIALCLSDSLIGHRLVRFLSSHRRILPISILVLLAFITAFVIAAWNITGPVDLAPGETLTRAVYLSPGDYTLTLDADTDAWVSIESQNRQETMMRTGTILFEGAVTEKELPFIVPTDSLVVFFNIQLPGGGTVQKVVYAGENGSGSIPLEYKLLPGFIVRRLQGLRANENAIQRTVFFEDGLKLFSKSPIVGLGMGGFEDNIRSIQSFYYVTKYPHNHYIQTMVETGIIGLILFLLLLGTSAASITLKWREERNMLKLSDDRQGTGIQQLRTDEVCSAWNSLTPTLGAALVFMAGHAAVEFVFSHYAYLSIAFSVFILINMCCGNKLGFWKLRLNENEDKKPASKGQKEIPTKKNYNSWSEVPRTWNIIRICLIALMSVFLIGYTVLLLRNMNARSLADRENTLEAMDKASNMDYFEWPDYSLKYIGFATENYDTIDSKVRKTADRHAERLGSIFSYTPYYVAEYYFRAGRAEEAYTMLEKFLDYDTSENGAWDIVFELLQANEASDPAYIEAVQGIIQKMDDWNANNLGMIELEERNRLFADRMRKNP